MNSQQPHLHNEEGWKLQHLNMVYTTIQQNVDLFKHVVTGGCPDKLNVLINETKLYFNTKKMYYTANYHEYLGEFE